jgi:hypothetical protein
LLSVVIPTRNAGRTLASCLASLARQDLPGVELIVVDNGSTDDTEAIARAAGARWLQVGGERSRQRNAGWRAARGPVVVFLDADMLAPVDLATGCHAAVSSGSEAAVIDERSVGQGFWASCRRLERTCYADEPFVEAARAFDRRLLQRVGGYDESLHAFEDWELHDRCLAAGARIGRVAPAAGPLLHDEGRLRLGERARKGAYYGQALARYRDRQGAARRLSPVRRAALFVRHAGTLARSPHLAAGLVVLKATEFLGSLAPPPLDPYAPAPALQPKAGEP